MQHFSLKIFNVLITSAFFCFLFLGIIQPVQTSAAGFYDFSQSFFTGCDNGASIGKNINGGNVNGVNNSRETNICDWNDFKTYLNKTINLLLGLGVFLSVLAFLFVGFKLLTSQGNSSALTAAYAMLWAVIKGFFFMLCAFLLVKFILAGLELKSGYSLLQ